MKSHRGVIVGLLLAGIMVPVRAHAQAPPSGRVYVIIWFDTEDYILPQSDAAAKRLAVFLTQQGVRATFKIVGEKARVLEERGRRDVIGALAQHEIGYHSNTHSQHPTPAEYEANLDWGGGVKEFDRRERAGVADGRRILGQTPTCYGQPGSSWAPESHAALKEWGVNVYLDEAGQVGMNGKPFWYGGLLNIFNTTEGGKLRPNEDWSNLAEAKEAFQGFYVQMTSRRGGGIISLYFHPCEFIHREFWDGVNFAHGANPPREEWKLPPMKDPAESEKAFQYFEDLVRYMKSFPLVEFITASQGSQLYRDTAQKRTYSPDDLAAIAGQVDAEVSFQVHDDYVLAASEAFQLLNTYVASVIRKSPPQPIFLDGTPAGPAVATAALQQPTEIPWSQFSRTVLDVAGFLEKERQIPSEVWFGSKAVSPESCLVALAHVTSRFLVKAEPPESVEIAPASLAAGKYVADDSPGLWGWVIFPPGFHAPKMMSLGRLQAWTMKPARLLGMR